MDKVTDIFFASHQGSWAILVVLFLVSFFLLQAGKSKPGKIVQMILRLFYIIMIVTGIGMLVNYDFPFVFIVKGILAIVLIGLMESALARLKRQEKAMTQLILVIAVLVVVALLGFGVITF